VSHSDFPPKNAILLWPESISRIIRSPVETMQLDYAARTGLSERLFGESVHCIPGLLCMVQAGNLNVSETEVPDGQYLFALPQSSY
jgi:hypothetical protein